MTIAFLRWVMEQIEANTSAPQSILEQPARDRIAQNNPAEAIAKVRYHNTLEAIAKVGYYNTLEAIAKIRDLSGR